MNIQEIKQELKYFSENPVGIIIYFILRKEDSIIIKKADIDSEKALPALRQQFLKRIQEQILLNEELTVMKISSADERRNVIYEYDLSEVPTQLNVINEVLSNEHQSKFNFKKDDIYNLKSYVILIGNSQRKLLLYKQHYPVSLIKRDGFFLKKDNERFIKFEDDLIRIDSNFEFFSIKDKLFIKDLEKLEKFYGFHDIIKRKAQQSIDKIDEEGLLADVEVLREELENMTFTRKLTKILDDSPVIGKIPPKAIIEFTKTNEMLKDKLKYTVDGERIILDTKKSKELFLRLLNDDILRSELTQEYYASLAKDRLSKSS